MTSIAKIYQVAPSTVLHWVRNFAIKVYEKPTPQGSVSIELDEMWHFIGQKKQMLDMEGILPHYRPTG